MDANILSMNTKNSLWHLLFLLVVAFQTTALAENLKFAVKLHTELKSRAKKHQELIFCGVSQENLGNLTEQDLMELFQVARVDFTENLESFGDDHEMLNVKDSLGNVVKVGIKSTNMFLCPRCRKHASKTDSDICSRCDDVMRSL